MVTRLLFVSKYCRIRDLASFTPNSGPPTRMCGSLPKPGGAKRDGRKIIAHYFTLRYRVNRQIESLVLLQSVWGMPASPKSITIDSR